MRSARLVGCSDQEGGTSSWSTGWATIAGVRRWQRRLTPLQRRLADGCRLDVDIEALIRKGPFREVQVERFLLEGTPRIVGSMYRGVAVK